MNICIIGLGLIGGSFALALRKYALTDRLYGVDASPRNAAKALELGLVDELIEWDRVAEAADIIVLATPVDVIPQLAIKLLNRIDDSRIVFDMGSTKEELCEIISQHPRRHRFVAAHPMWGTEHSGPEAAVEDAFVGCNTVLCDVEQSDADAVSAVERIFTTIGMKIMYMSPAQHDTHAAYVSHISHITSFILATTVLEKERESATILNLAGGGFESTVRLAKSSPDMWIPILMQNKYNVLDVLREYIHQLEIFRKALERDNRAEIRQTIERANEIRKVLDKK
ncbi:MAG: prephenate dehydrogenase [Alistipes sp.]|nr:prephenate dehydrogenase [Alistipes sp.]